MSLSKKSALVSLVSIAEEKVGVMETKGLNNVGPDVQMFQTATWLAPGPWAWCAAFMCWTLKQWISLPENFKLFNLTSLKDAENWRCKDARAFGWEAWATKRNLKILPETELAKLGDIVIFDFSHIGIVSADQTSKSSSIYTIEGNTNGSGDRDSESGDGVWKKIRRPSLTKCYIRLLE